MQTITRNLITYRRGDILSIKNISALSTFINSGQPASKYRGECVVFNTTYHFKKGIPFYTYDVDVNGVEIYDISESDMDKLFICPRVLRIKRERNLKKLKVYEK